MLKRLMVMVGAILLVAKAVGENKGSAFAFPNGSGAARGCDPLGCGHFNAVRSDRRHRGHDFLVQPGDTVKSPIQGRASRYPYPYSGDTYYRGVEIIGTGVHKGFLVKMYYLKPGVAINANVRPGQAVGIAQDVSLKHGPAMKPHVHLEIYRNGVNVDPAQFFPSS